MFKEVLQTALNNTEGGVGVLIVGTDGIVVESVRQSETAGQIWMARSRNTFH